MAIVPPARHLQRAKDLADARYQEGIKVADMARAAGLSKSHFSREFNGAFGDSPRRYLLTRRLERAASLLRNTDHPVNDICFSVGLTSVASFTNSFTRSYGMPPTKYRDSFPDPKLMALVPACVVHAYSRPPREAKAGSVPMTARFDKGPAPRTSSFGDIKDKPRIKETK